MPSMRVGMGLAAITIIADGICERTGLAGKKCRLRIELVPELTLAPKACLPLEANSPLHGALSRSRRKFEHR